MKNKQHVIRALIFSLIVSAPYLLEYVVWGGYSNRIFSDWDEPHYLIESYRAGALPLKNWFIWDGARPLAFNQLDTVLPHALVDALVGNIGLLFSLKLSTLAVILDLLTAFLAFLGLRKFFLCFNSDWKVAESATLVTLSLPWLSSLLEGVLYSPNGLASASHAGYVCLPVVRAVYTQVSYPLFCLALYYLADAKSNQRSLFILGAVGSVLLYFYLFAFLSFHAIAATYLSISLFNDRKNLIRGLIGYIAGALLVALPGLYLFFSSGELLSPGPDPSLLGDNLAFSFSDYWYFSIEYFLLLLASLLFAFKYKNSLAAIIASILTAQFVLMNLQAALDRMMQPYHFTLFYLHPVLSGCFVLLVFQLIKDKGLRKVLLTFISLIPLVCSLFLIKNFRAKSDETSEFVHAARAIDQKTQSGDVVAVLPYELDTEDETLAMLILPFWVEAATAIDRHVMPLLITAKTNRLDNVRKESLIGWLYTGNQQLVGLCPDSIGTNDIVSGAQFILNFARMAECAIDPEDYRYKDPAAQLRNMGVNYILLKKGQSIQSDHIGRKVVWTSPDKQYRLLKINW